MHSYPVGGNGCGGDLGLQFKIVTGLFLIDMTSLYFLIYNAVEKMNQSRGKVDPWVNIMNILLHVFGLQYNSCNNCI